ncbi:MAG TPA: ribonucleotide reductase N-terminal alpha domain-containing protein, partial [Blastocatellia bacterium]|nr:ribonucleotide reductase N-terminal alpha domain-containing protein [Blastocatellia bacterium]
MSTRSMGDLDKTNGQTSLEDPIPSVALHADLPRVGVSADTNDLNELGQKIFLDRYAMKDMHKRTLGVGDMVIVCVDDKTGQREIATVRTLDGPRVSLELRDGTVIERLIEHVAKPIETDPEQMMERVARGIAAVEGEQAEAWYHKFRWLLQGWKFVPAGRILTAAGTDQQLTFYNCYVVPSPKDSRRGIVDTLSQMMEIMSRGGGVGINVSSLRPRHSYVRGVNGRSSGAVSWGALYSFVTGLIEQGGSRRGALMLILNCWHPDVVEFINAKRDMGKITNANVSVGITDKFMQAVEADADWDLVFADTSDPDYETMWDGNLEKWLAAGKKVVTHKTIKARKIWDSIIESAWASAEPGVFFIERANRMSNSWYYDTGYLGCTNPCGEQPLPGFGVCNLGAINLSKFVQGGEVDWESLGRSVRYAVRFLDDVIDATPYFFDENYAQQKSERRVGLNTMGLAEMLIRLGIRYGSDESVEFIDRLYQFIATE